MAAVPLQYHFYFLSPLVNESNVIVQKSEIQILINFDYLDSKKHFAIVFTKCQSVRCRCRRWRCRVRAENIDVPNLLN